MLSRHICIAAYLLTCASAYSTVCNPLKDTSCSTSDTALTDSPVTVDFSSESGVSTYFKDYSGNGELNYTSDGLELTLAKRFDNPSIKSEFYLMFGRIEVVAKPAYGTGIVSTVYLQSDDLDEIDLEWVGTDTSNVQTNWFSKGDTTTYDRGEYNSLESKADLFNSFHNYTVDWTNEHVKWYIDGELVRTLGNSSSEGFPQTPMAIFVGVWAGGDPSNSDGTIEWAGGETNYEDAPFSMLLKSMLVENYSTGSSYTYSGTTGTWESIDATDGEVLAAVVDYSGSAASSAVSSSSSTTVSSSSSTAASTVSTTVSSSSSSSTTVSTATSSSSSSSSSSSAVSSTVDASGTTTLAPASSSTPSILTSYANTTSSSLVTSFSSSSATASIATSSQANSAAAFRASGGLSYSGNTKIFFALLVSLATLVMI